MGVDYQMMLAAAVEAARQGLRAGGGAASTSWQRLALALGLVCCGFGASAEDALRQVSVQLLWKHQFEFAGYYAAQEKGFYRDAGLEVTLIEAGTEPDSVEAVLTGKADFGVGSSGLLLYRANGQPVVVLGVIFQHSPFALMTLERSHVANIHQLVGKRVMGDPQSAELLAYLKREGIPENQLKFVPHSFGVEELLNGKVDAMTVYTTNEPFAAQKAGLNYSLFSPRSAGIDFYGDNFFTTEGFLHDNPKVVAAFREATLRGWEYAMAHPEEMADLIIARYGKEKSKDWLMFEYEQMKPLLRTDLVALGYMYPGRWRHIADVYAELGMLQPDFPIKNFLYNPDAPHLPVWAYWVTGGVLGFSLLVGGISLYIMRINRRLSAAMVEREQTEFSLKASEQHYRAIYEAVPLALILFDQENRVIDWNHAAEQIFGWPKLAMLGQSMEMFVPEAELDSILKGVAQAWEGSIVNGTNHNLTREGRTILCRWSNVAYQDGHGETVGVLSLAEDITEKQRLRDEVEEANHSLRLQIEQIQSLQDELRELALHDPLTKLYNRRYFHELLERELAQSEREGKKLSLVMIDIDFFKRINDTFGHLVGDQVLVALAGILATTTRKGDSAFRFGGEEFVLVFPGMDEQAGFVRAESLRKLFAELSFPTEAGEARTTLSAGVATWPTHAQEANKLLGKADKALYAAKEAGRNRTEIAE